MSKQYSSRIPLIATLAALVFAGGCATWNAGAYIRASGGCDYSEPARPEIRPCPEQKPHSGPARAEIVIPSNYDVLCPEQRRDTLTHLAIDAYGAYAKSWGMCTNVLPNNGFGLAANVRRDVRDIMASHPKPGTRATLTHIVIQGRQ